MHDLKLDSAGQLSSSVEKVILHLKLSVKVFLIEFALVRWKSIFKSNQAPEEDSAAALALTSVTTRVNTSTTDSFTVREVLRTSARIALTTSADVTC